MINISCHNAMNGEDGGQNRSNPGFRPPAPTPRPPISFKPRLKTFKAPLPGQGRAQAAGQDRCAVQGFYGRLAAWRKNRLNPTSGSPTPQRSFRSARGHHPITR